MALVAEPPVSLRRGTWRISRSRPPAPSTFKMEAQVARLVDKTWDMYQNLPNSKRLIIGVAGIPGSGRFDSILQSCKTTLASRVANQLNDKFRQSSPGRATGHSHPLAAALSMDGYHLTREQLSAMPDPTNAHARRGAAFTFDATAYYQLIKRLRDPITPESTTLYAPSFDHAIKDPVENDIKIPTAVRVLLFEGNYVALDEEPWRDARELMDEVWFVEVDEVEARKRLVSRHIKAGIAKNEEEAGRRADENDLINGREITEKRLKVDEVITSIDDKGWRPETQDFDQDYGS